MAAEIVQINTQDFTSQTYEGQDVNLISTFEINTSLSASSYIEAFIYDNNQNILSSNYNFSQYTVLNNGQSPGTNNDIFQIEINPEETLLIEDLIKDNIMYIITFLINRLDQNFNNYTLLKYLLIVLNFV
jgi:hypothetical protein